jgi:hypothetical protein
MSTNKFRGRAQQIVELSPLDISLCGHLKTLVYSVANANKETLNQHTFYACQPFTKPDDHC